MLYWRRLIPARRHPPVEGCNLLSFSSHYWKGAPTLWSRLPASPGRELLTLVLIYQPLLEGSYYPCSHLPASLGRELLPPALVYQLPLEGSYKPPHWRLQPSAPPWTMFHQFSYWIQQLPYNTTCRPLFNIFSDWTHSTHLSPKNIYQTKTHSCIKSFNESPINQLITSF